MEMIKCYLEYIFSFVLKCIFRIYKYFYCIENGKKNFFLYINNIIIILFFFCIIFYF